MEEHLLDDLRVTIMEELVKSGSEGARLSFRKFVPTSVRVYGVRLPVVNQLARQHKKGGFDLAIKLWRSGAFEEQLLAAKILGLAARDNPDRAVALVLEFSSGVTDWAVCDTLGMQSVKSIAAKNEDKVIEAARKLLKSSRMWQRRVGIVLLTHYTKVTSKQEAIRAMLYPLRIEQEHYIKKAIAWIDRDLAKFT